MEMNAAANVTVLRSYVILSRDVNTSALKVKCFYFQYNDKIMLLYILLTFLLMKCHVHNKQPISQSFLKRSICVRLYIHFIMN